MSPPFMRDLSKLNCKSRIWTWRNQGAEQNEELHRAVQDDANKDRRLNLHLVCLKEKLESDAPQDYVRRIISLALGIHLAENKLQRTQ